jgi:hypothetical protein
MFLTGKAFSFRYQFHSGAIEPLNSRVAEKVKRSEEEALTF